METKEEKPTLYIITGHKGSGKTTHLADLLPDHPFLPEVHQENKKMEEVNTAFYKHDDEEKYNTEIDKVIDETANYLDKQIQSRENIYIETEASNLTPAYFSNKTSTQYNSHCIYLMCDSGAVQINRLAAMPNAMSYMDLENNVTWSNRIANYELNKYATSTPGRLDIYDGTGNKPKLLATMHDGKVIIASPKILKKEWLSKESPLGQQIEKYLGVDQKAQLIRKRSTARKHANNKQDTSKKEKRNRIKR